MTSRVVRKKPTAAVRKSMQANRSSGTKPELALWEALCERMPWIKEVSNVERNAKGLPGSPDVAFHGRRVAVFMDGCFWHGCPRHGSKPKSNASFWAKKFDANKRRDKRDSLRLKSQGWTVVRVWECAVKKEPGEAAEKVSSVVSLARFLKGGIVRLSPVA